DSIDLAGHGVLDAVVDEQPAVLGPKRRRPEADPQRVPPGTGTRSQHLLRSAPAKEIVGAGEEDLRVPAAKLRLGAMQKNPAAVEPVGYERRVLVFGMPDDPVALDRDEVLGRCEKD